MHEGSHRPSHPPASGLILIVQKSFINTGVIAFIRVKLVILQKGNSLSYFDQVWVLLSAYLTYFTFAVIIVILCINVAIFYNVQDKIKTDLVLSSIGSLIFPRVLLKEDLMDDPEDSG